MGVTVEQIGESVAELQILEHASSKTGQRSSSTPAIAGAVKRCSAGIARTATANIHRIRGLFRPERHSFRAVSATDADVNGKLFLSSDGRFFRGISRGSEALFRRLARSGVIESLVQKGLLVDSWVCNRHIDGYPLVFEHRRIPYITYSSEWSFEMLRVAALQVLALQRELITHGLQLHDCHCMNVLFQATQPVYVDLTSLETLSKTDFWPSLDEFRRWYLHPLAMASAGYRDEARTMMGDYLHAVPATVVEKLCPELVANWSHLSYHAPEVNEKNRIGLIDALVRDIVSIPLSRRTTDWSDYYQGTPTAIDPGGEWRPKQERFYQILQEVRPGSLVDIASNRGIYGQMAARMGITVAAFDRDETAIADLYNDALDRGLPITPLICDLMNPTPARGMNGTWWPSVHDRLQSDMAVALALVHHLVFKAHLDFEQIVTCFARFARKSLVVEFIPREDTSVRQWLRPEHDWYTLHNFLAALRKRFKRIRIVPSDPDPRLLILCER